MNKEIKYKAITTKNEWEDDNPTIKRKNGQTRVYISGIAQSEDRHYFVVEYGEVKLIKE